MQPMLKRDAFFGFFGGPRRCWFMRPWRTVFLRGAFAAAVTSGAQMLDSATKVKREVTVDEGCCWLMLTMKLNVFMWNLTHCLVAVDKLLLCAGSIGCFMDGWVKCWFTIVGPMQPRVVFWITSGSQVISHANFVKKSCWYGWLNRKP